jgi:hypothetical protein
MRGDILGGPLRQPFQRRETLPCRALTPKMFVSSTGRRQGFDQKRTRENSCQIQVIGTSVVVLYANNHANLCYRIVSATGIVDPRAISGQYCGPRLSKTRKFFRGSVCHQVQSHDAQVGRLDASRPDKFNYTVPSVRFVAIWQRILNHHLF